MSNKFDASNYSEFWTRPKRVFARKLTKPEKYETTVNGLLTEVPAHAGDWEVVVTKADGSLLKKVPFTDDQFKRKYGSAGIDGDLFSYHAEHEDDETE